MDLAGWWLDSDVLRIGSVTVRAGARVETRATLMSGAVVGEEVEVAAGTCVVGEAVSTPGVWPPVRTPSTRGRWTYSLALGLIGLLPIVVAVPGLLLPWFMVNTDGTLAQVVLSVVESVVPATLVSLACYAGVLALAVRLAGRVVRPGLHRSDGRVAWSAWLVTRLTDTARTTLFPIYAGMLTPIWLRLMGARIGRRVEASTAHTAPSLLSVSDGASSPTTRCWPPCSPNSS